MNNDHAADAYYDDIDLYTDEEMPTEEELSSGGQESFFDISTVPDWEKRSFGFPFVTEFTEGQGCHCEPGVSCRQGETSPYRFVFGREIKNKRLPLLRLTGFESWQLPGYEVGQGDFRVFEERGPRAPGIWRSTAIFEKSERVKIEPSCRNDSFWFVSGRSVQQGAWLFHVKQAEDRGLYILVYCEESENVIAENYSSPNIFWTGFGFKRYRRLVEYQFVLYKAIQVSAIVSQWPSQLQKDLPNPLYREIFEGIPHALTRGFLRLLR